MKINIKLECVNCLTYLEEKSRYDEGKLIFYECPKCKYKLCLHFYGVYP